MNVVCLIRLLLSLLQSLAPVGRGRMFLCRNRGFLGHTYGFNCTNIALSFRLRQFPLLILL